MKRLLIANRGEIACRIIRTCRTLGIETVAVTSEAEAGSLWMQMADFGVVLGGGPAKESYLNADKIIEYAHFYKVDAIHPGYGFLSENPEFAQRTRDEGFIFVGPSKKAMETMGSKSKAKMIAFENGVSIISGYTGEEQTLEILQKEADHIGYPLLIKATYGGGGKGMRLVQEKADFAMALRGCQREAEGAFGSAAVMLEKYIVNPRHIEVQILADQHGEILTLSHRDCSLQRRHQKVIEEAPAVDLPSVVYKNIEADALKIAKAVTYEGAGTVEFLVEATGQHYFLEMNTRLQVEHPVTEEILGLDLVALQLQIAQGHPLSFQQSDLEPHGHALEARLYAEDSQQGFLPSTGRLIHFNLPHHEDVRIETGYEKGDMVTPYYDPLLAKIIVWGENRRAAYGHLTKALSVVKVEGVKTNLSFLKQLAVSSEVTDSYPPIGYIDHFTACLDPSPIPAVIYALACGWLYKKPQKTETNQHKEVRLPPWQQEDGWRLNEDQTTLYSFMDQEEPLTISLYYNQTGMAVHVKGEVLYFQQVKARSSTIWVLKEEHSLKAHIHQGETSLTVQCEKNVYTLILDPLDGKIYNDYKVSSHLNAPMPGRLVSIFVKKDDEVEKGAALLILEAMKMEHTIRAPYKGKVEKILYEVGSFVEAGAELINLKAETEPLKAS